MTVTGLRVLHLTRRCLGVTFKYHKLRKFVPKNDSFFRWNMKCRFYCPWIMKEPVYCLKIGPTKLSLDLAVPDHDHPLEKYRDSFTSSNAGLFNSTAIYPDYALAILLKAVRAQSFRRMIQRVKAALGYFLLWSFDAQRFRLQSAINVPFGSAQ